MADRMFKVILVMGFLTTTAQGADTSAAKADLAELQGMWSMVEYVSDGLESTQKQINSWVLIIEGDQYNPGIREYSVEFTIRLNPARTPKAIDLIHRTGSSRGRTLRGIYKIEGDRFTLCYANDTQGDRPAGFTVREGSGLVRVCWQRHKDALPR